MSRVCEICGKKPAAGRSIIRKGSPKYKGGIGLHTTGISKRRFLPNLQTVRVTDGKGNTSRKTICTRCLKAGKVTKA
ncbi:MAG: 50S ribosomal protein L28 [bacterium]|nr:50S ribosomal protein L28 [bacterium]MDO5311955.1 50S ribosomal protein L28 [bacterium]